MYDCAIAEKIDHHTLELEVTDCLDHCLNCQPHIVNAPDGSFGSFDGTCLCLWKCMLEASVFKDRGLWIGVNNIYKVITTMVIRLLDDPT